ncbi:hypothetical protein RYX36_013022 [Vicia faba]
MATIVRGTLISNSVKLLLKKLVSTEFEDNFRSTKLDVLKKLKTTLRWVQNILNDAEEQQFTNPDFKNWLNTLRYVSEFLKPFLNPSLHNQSVIALSMQTFVFVHYLRPLESKD